MPMTEKKEDGKQKFSITDRFSFRESALTQMCNCNPYCQLLKASVVVDSFRTEQAAKEF